MRGALPVCGVLRGRVLRASIDGIPLVAIREFEISVRSGRDRPQTPIQVSVKKLSAQEQNCWQSEPNSVLVLSMVCSQLPSEKGLNGGHSNPIIFERISIGFSFGAKWRQKGTL